MNKTVKNILKGLSIAAGGWIFATAPWRGPNLARGGDTEYTEGNRFLAAALLKTSEKTPICLVYPEGAAIAPFDKSSEPALFFNNPPRKRTSPVTLRDNFKMARSRHYAPAYGTVDGTLSAYPLAGLCVLKKQDQTTVAPIIAYQY